MGNRRWFMRTVCSAAIAVALVLTFMPASSPAKIGVGIVAGEPSGFSFKWWSDGSTGVDAATGWSLDEGDFYAHCDYLWHRAFEDREIGGTVPLYFGIGGRLLLREDDDSKLGVRIPVGVDYILGEGRFDVFVEIAPIFNFVPETEFDLSGGIGARFYF
jgi:hypothetical protein